MAYIIKKEEEFRNEIDKYLEKYPMNESKEEKSIKAFNSTELSDLYKLFVKLNKISINKELFIILKEKIKANFSFDINEIFDKDDEGISPKNMEALENIIKTEFIKTLNGEKKDISQEEFYKLTVIVNKVYPSYFLALIKEPQNNIENTQKIIKERVMETIEHWSEHNTDAGIEEDRDILGALYIGAQKIYPEMSIYIPGRIKSTRSALNNINKEAANSLKSLIPDDISRGLTSENVEEQFNIEKANTDFTGFTIVLGNTDDTMHFDINAPKTKEILVLRKLRDECINYSHSLENFLAENDEMFLNQQDLLKIKIELLMRLRILTYEECTKEYKGTSFEELLKKSLERYNQKEKRGYINAEEYLVKLDEIYELLDEMKKRVHDKYQAKILEIAVPEILNDEIVKDVLHIKWKFVKKVRKPNGFCAAYYELITNDGRRIELQAITKMRFKESKDGSADHSKLPNKEIKINQFFEPALEGCNQSDFEKMLNFLDNLPIAKKNTLYTTQDQELSPMDRRLKRKIKAAEQNIKLKEIFEEEYEFPDGTIQRSSYPIDVYLKNFAEYVSPELMSVSSHHTRFNKGVAGYNKKSLLSAFTEVLLKNDSTSCLAQILIDKLEEILPNDKNEISRNGIIKRSNKRYVNSDGNRDDGGVEL